MKRPVFSFRPNMENAQHKRAWEILQGVPDGQKNSYLVQVILQDEKGNHLEEMIRRAVREEIGGNTAGQQNVRKQDNLPGNMLEFLSRIEQED